LKSSSFSSVYHAIEDGKIEAAGQLAWRANITPGGLPAIRPHHRGTPSLPAEQYPVHPSLWNLFSTLLLIGIQSFGGGSSTFYLIHQVTVSRGWISEEEFVRSWALAQVSPGINLLKLVVMIGYRLRGWPGLFAISAGMLLPSALITVLMTAGFSAISSQPLIKSALRGILPATIGLSLAMAVQMAQPVLTRAYQEGFVRLGAHVLILASAALLLALAGLSPVLILLLSGVATILALAILPDGARKREEGEP
jgi:chromate transporter